ncbi:MULTISPECIES: hypothetical protein [unclassified Gordonia (in: high G+C Gram-positive bacteria)]|uniref:hypothetical protein n=1 Tax=unclassified Gordonia (in: high G+C Gram-positive bacteria) TaxID=2657482 RepID=UPI001F109932|nr:hypothetical protein [Gordonia sp. ABSL49_1]MCH5645397.1 hypothetical protein [Gordonia sp. ABSL49_1]
MPLAAVVSVPILAVAAVIAAVTVYRRTRSLVGALFTAGVACVVAYGVFIFVLMAGQPSMDIE